MIESPADEIVGQFRRVQTDGACVMRQINLGVGAYFAGNASSTSFSLGEGPNTAVLFNANNNYLYGDQGDKGAWNSHTVSIDGGMNNGVAPGAGDNSASFSFGSDNWYLGNGGTSVVKLTDESFDYVNTGVGTATITDNYGYKDDIVTPGDNSRVVLNDTMSAWVNTSGSNNAIFVGPGTINTSLIASGGNAEVLLWPGADPNLSITELPGASVTMVDLTKPFDPALLNAAFGIYDQGGGEKGFVGLSDAQTVTVATVAGHT